MLAVISYACFQKSYLLNVTIQIAKVSFHIVKNALSKLAPDMSALHYERILKASSFKVITVFTSFTFIKQHIVSYRSMSCLSNVLKLL